MVAKLLAEGVADLAAALPPTLLAFMEARPADVDACPCGASFEACVCVVPCGCGSSMPGLCLCPPENVCAEVVL